MAVTGRIGRLAGALALAMVMAPGAAPAAYPEKDITFVIPFSAGGGFDTYVRAVVPAMEKYLPNKVNIIPTNVAAAGGAKGASQVYRAKPDGYTIGVFNIPGQFVLQQQGESGYDLNRISWLGSLGRDTYGIAVGWNSPIKSVAELKGLGATRKLKFTSTGPASTVYGATLIASELLGMAPEVITGYKGSSDYLLGAVRGDGDAAIATLPYLRRMQGSQTLRVLATFEPHGTFQGVQDATALGQPDLAQVTLERLVGGPPGLPDNIRTVLAEALRKAEQDPAVKAWAAAADVELTAASPDQAAATLRDQAAFFDKWKKYLIAP